MSAILSLTLLENPSAARGSDTWAGEEETLDALFSVLLANKQFGRSFEAMYRSAAGDGKIPKGVSVKLRGDVLTRRAVERGWITAHDAGMAKKCLAKAGTVIRSLAEGILSVIVVQCTLRPNHETRTVCPIMEVEVHDSGPGTPGLKVIYGLLEPQAGHRGSWSLPFLDGTADIALGKVTRLVPFNIRPDEGVSSQEEVGQEQMALLKELAEAQRLFPGKPPQEWDRVKEGFDPDYPFLFCGANGLSASFSLGGNGEIRGLVTGNSRSVASPRTMMVLKGGKNRKGVIRIRTKSKPNPALSQGRVRRVVAAVTSAISTVRLRLPKGRGKGVR